MIYLLSQTFIFHARHSLSGYKFFMKTVRIFKIFLLFISHKYTFQIWCFYVSANHQRETQLLGCFKIKTKNEVPQWTFEILKIFDFGSLQFFITSKSNLSWAKIICWLSLFSYPEIEVKDFIWKLKMLFSLKCIKYYFQESVGTPQMKTQNSQPVGLDMCSGCF